MAMAHAMSQSPPYPALHGKEADMNPDTVVFWATTGLSVALWMFV